MPMSKDMKLELKADPARWEQQPRSKAHAAQRGESVNGFINRAIDEAIMRDNTHKEDE